MDIRIKSTDYQMTPDVAAYLDERIAVVEKMLGSDAEAARCEVELGRAAGGQRHGEHMWFAEMNVSYPGSALINATNNAQNINSAIDDVKEEVVRQLRSERQSHRRIMRRGGAALKRFMRLGE